ncbi:hypothetical protein ACFL0X_03085 [Nanoarchaeota archaeon]
MLGQDDFEGEFGNFSRSIFGGGMLNKMLGSAMKALEKEIRKDMKRDLQPRTNFHLFLNGRKVNIDGSNAPQQQRVKQKVKEALTLPRGELKGFANFEKKEPVTNIRRLSDKILYDIDLPGVKSLKDVSIIKLENSIEIKALANECAYFKSIPINLKIMNYSLENERLIFELSV